MDSDKIHNAYVHISYKELVKHTFEGTFKPGVIYIMDDLIDTLDIQGYIVQIT